MGCSNLSYQKKKREMCYLNFSTEGQAEANEGHVTFVN